MIKYLKIVIFPDVRCLGSISSNFLCTCFLYKILAPKITKQNITREKLLNLLSYKKCTCKILMKLTPGLSRWLHVFRPLP